MISTDFDIAPATGYVYQTKFIFTDITVYDAPVANRFWNFGDGTVAYDDISVTHTYNYGDNFKVSLTAADIKGNVSVSERTLKVEYLVRDQLRFISVPGYESVPGLPTTNTFKIGVTSAQINQPIQVMLHSANSRSVPYFNVSEKWRYLTPTWRFTDTSHTPITALVINTKPLYENSVQIGSYGEGEFYYIDDIGTEIIEGDCSLIIHATLMTENFVNYKDNTPQEFPAYANTKAVRASIIWQVEKLIPDYLKITNNLIDGIHPTHWVGAKIPVLLTIHSDKNTTEKNYGVLFSYPSNNIHGKRTAIQLEIEGLSPNEYIVEDDLLSFQATDENGLPAGGVLYTTITPLVTANRARITGYTYAVQDSTQQKKFLVPLDYPVPLHAWISNTEFNILNRITLLSVDQNNQGKTSCQEEIGNTFDYTQQSGSTITTYVPYISSNSVINYNLTGVSGAFGLAILPATFDMIAVDSESDAIYKYKTTGELISGIQLKITNNNLTVTNYPITATPTTPTYIGYESEISLMPSYISVDRKHNFWVTLYNSVSVLKFNSDFKVVAAAVPVDGETMAEHQGEKLFKPPVVETDRLNNIWVTYAQTLCSALFKYDENGNFLKSITLPASSLPVGLAITPENHVWVANSKHETSQLGTIQKYHSDGTLLASVTGFGRPSFIALDRDANVWFTHGIRNIGFINSVTLQTSSWYVDGAPTSGIFKPIKIPDPEFLKYVNENEELGGLAVDASNRVWVIDSLYNNVYVISATPVNVTNNTNERVKVVPDSLRGYMPDIRTAFTIRINNKRFKSAQATGDWTGNRWLQKFGDVKYFDGKSDYFSIYNFNDNFKLKKVNENFSIANQYKELALPEHLQKNDNLFDKFFAAVGGNSQTSNFEDIGEKVYERIANFIYSHADIDTCSIEQLLSLCKAVDLPVNGFAAEYPASIKTALEFFSTPKERLRGVQDTTPALAKSVGKILDTKTSILTAGQKIFLQNKFNTSYTLITVPKQNNQSIYPLTEFNGVGFAQPVINNYLFYEYEPYTPFNEETNAPIYIENIADWTNSQTTFNFNLSSKDDWYGDNGIVEKTFNYILTKNLTKNS